MNQLENLKKITTVMADSSDIESIYNYKPEGATTNPSLILKAVKIAAYKPLLENALAYARKQGGTKQIQVINASDKLAVNVGLEILKIVPWCVSTEVDVRLSFDYKMCIKRARKLILLYQEQEIDKYRVLIKLAATWEGIQAAKELEKEGIHCNLTLLFSLTQARACAEAGAYLVSPFVGRVCDWYNQNKKINQHTSEKDPGVMLIKKIFNYYKRYHYKTIIMGASLRTIDQILVLAGCDSLTIPPALLKKLQKGNKIVERKLSPPLFFKSLHQPVQLSEEEFRWKHNQNPMAVEKLAEGIRQFAIDQKILENLLAKKL